MIVNFSSKVTEDIYHGVLSRYSRKLPIKLHAKAVRLLDQINAASRIEDLNTPPANKLRKLSGDLSELWRIKINNQWAIIFKWKHGNALDVGIVDYH